MKKSIMPEFDSADAIGALAELIARIAQPHRNERLTRSAVEMALVELGYDEGAVLALTRGGAG